MPKAWGAKRSLPLKLAIIDFAVSPYDDVKYYFNSSLYSVSGAEVNDALRRWAAELSEPWELLKATERERDIAQRDLEVYKENYRVLERERDSLLRNASNLTPVGGSPNSPKHPPKPYHPDRRKP